MNRLFFACTVFVMLSPGAMAADIEVVPDSSGFEWTGFRIGVFGAYGVGDSDSSDGVDREPSDPYFGFRAGYGAELDRLYLGIEGEVTLADLDDDGGSGADFISMDIDNIASIAGIVGLPWNQAMPYVFAGWNWADSERNDLNNRDTAHINGLAVGLGLQYQFQDHWILRAQVAHYDYGKVTYDIPGDPSVKTTVNAATLGVDFRFP